eukprot:g886.t1
MPALDFSALASLVFLMSAAHDLYGFVCGRAARRKATHHTLDVPRRDAKANSYRLIENLVEPDETIIQRDRDAGGGGLAAEGLGATTDMTLLFRRAEAGKKKRQTPRLENATLWLVFFTATLQVVRAYCAASGIAVKGMRERTAGTFCEAVAWVFGAALILCEDAKHAPRGSVVICWWLSTLVLRLCAAAELIHHGGASTGGRREDVALGLWAAQTVLYAALAWAGLTYMKLHRKSQRWQRYKDAVARLRVVGQSKFGRLLRVVQQDVVYIVIAIVAASTVAGCTIMFNIIWGGLIDQVTNSNRAGLQSLIYQLAAVCVVIGLAAAVQSFYVQIAGVRLVLRLQNLAYASLVEQEVAWFDSNKTGELMTVLGTNTQMVQDGLTTNLV